MDLKKLRELAEKATPGPWKYDSAGGISIVWAANGRRDLAFDLDSEDAAHIAAMNPQTALALIAVAEAAGKIGEPVKTIVDDEVCLYCLESENSFSSRPIKHSEDCPWLRLRVAFETIHKLEAE